MIYLCWVWSERSKYDAAETTAAELVITTTPTDDAGAATADAYDWQAAMAAADGLALYLAGLDEHGELRADDDCRIVCEHHEDWVVIKAGDAELVSAKHKDSSFGAYTTVYKLVSDGGLGHLFARWYVMDGKPTCRLVTTPGLSAGPSQILERAAVHLRGQRLAGDALTVGGDDATATVAFAALLRKHPDSLLDGWRAGSANDGSSPSEQHRADACRFLSMLTIQHGRPQRAYLGHAAPSMFAKPILDRLESPPHLAEPVWEAAIALFRARMRAAGPRPAGALPAVMPYRQGIAPLGAAEAERDLASRIVTLGDIDVAVRTAITFPLGYQPLKPALRTTRTAVKMEVGQCADNSIERAEHLRLDYLRYWRARRSGDPDAMADQEKLLRELLRACDEATAAVATSAVSPWGAALWSEIQAGINRLPANLCPEGMDPDLLLGGVCELARRCRVWFSAPFDVDAEITRRRGLLGAAS